MFTACTCICIQFSFVLSFHLIFSNIDGSDDDYDEECTNEIANSNNNDNNSKEGLKRSNTVITEQQKHQLKHRELFLSRQVECLPATHIRGNILLDYFKYI